MLATLLISSPLYILSNSYAADGEKVIREGDFLIRSYTSSPEHGPGRTTSYKLSASDSTFITEETNKDKRSFDSTHYIRVNIKDSYVKNLVTETMKTNATDFTSIAKEALKPDINNLSNKITDLDDSLTKKGLNLSADSGTGHVNLGDTLSLVSANSNITTNTNNGTFSVKLADNLNVTGITAKTGSIDTLSAKTVTADTGTFKDMTTDTLTAKIGSIDTLSAKTVTADTGTFKDIATNTLTAKTGSIDTLSAKMVIADTGTFKDMTTDTLTAKTGSIDTLSAKTVTADTGTFKDIATNTLTAKTGSIDTLSAKTVTADTGTFKDITTNTLTAKTASLHNIYADKADISNLTLHTNLNANGHRIENVANAIADSDAVNLGQLKSTAADVEHRMTHDIRHTGAIAAALAGLHPLPFDAERKLAFSASSGQYRGMGALALGAFYQPNNDTLFSLGGTVSGGEKAFNAGITVRFGVAGKKKEVVTLEKDKLLAIYQALDSLKKEVEKLKSSTVK